jgi:predicted nuclease with TOPRIM domain
MKTPINTYTRVDGYSNLVRDETTNAIVNMNYSSYNSYMQMKTAKKEEMTRIDQLETDMTNIKNELSEIKSLIRAALK